VTEDNSEHFYYTNEKFKIFIISGWNFIDCFNIKNTYNFNLITSSIAKINC
jgi:hypothetical protein